MQISIRRHGLVALLALSVATCSLGCKSTGWHMPSPNWMSWSKKKPTTSAIAGTRSMPQPPSISVPPYASSNPSTGTPSAYGQTAANSTLRNPSGTNASYGPNGYGQNQLAGTSRPAANSGYYTGPYNTGGAGTQRGFYSPTLSQPSGAATYTADTRNGMTRGTPTTSGATAAPGQPNANPYAGSAGGSTAPPLPSASSSWPASPRTGYGSTTPGTGYSMPAGSSGNGAPAAQPSATVPSYPGASATPGYGAGAGTLSPNIPSTPVRSYGSSLPVPATSSGAYNAVSTGWSRNSTGTTSPVSSATSSASTGYRPGSTSRGSNLLGAPEPSTTTRYPGTRTTLGTNPAGATGSAYPLPGGGSVYGSPARTASPLGAASAYPSTYSR